MSSSREKVNEVIKRIEREADAAATAATDRMTRRHGLLGGPMGTLNTITPCAACKLLRRRCAQECPFSPYFSPHEPQKFASVHKVFGASNVAKLLTEISENQRADAANSLVYEANIRLRDPIYGCMGLILALQQQLQALEVELAGVKDEILKYKYRQSAPAADFISVRPSSHLLLAAVAGEAAVSIVATPIPAMPAPASSSSSMYTAASNSTDYSSITTENVSYYG